MDPKNLDPNSNDPSVTNASNPSDELNKQYQDILNKYAEELNKMSTQNPIPEPEAVTSPTETQIPETPVTPAAEPQVQSPDTSSLVDLGGPSLETNPTPPTEADLVPSGPSLPQETSILPEVPAAPATDLLSELSQSSTQEPVSSTSEVQNSGDALSAPLPPPSDFVPPVPETPISPIPAPEIAPVPPILPQPEAPGVSPPPSQPLSEPIAPITPPPAFPEPPMPTPQFESFTPTDDNKPKGGIFKILFIISLLVFLAVSGILAYTFVQKQNSPSDSGNGPTPTQAASDNSAATGEVCELNDKQYAVGESFPAADGCNTCSCQPDLTIACTEKDCSASDSSSTESTTQDASN